VIPNIVTSLRQGFGRWRQSPMLKVCVAALLAGLTVPAPSRAFAATNAAPQASDLTVADNLYRAGRFAEAAVRYEAILKSDPSLVTTQNNLIHCLLFTERIDEAKAAAIKALDVQPNSGELVSAMGDVQFRLAEMPEAERSYLKAEELDPRNPSPYLGLVRIYRSYSMNRRAYDQLQRAHEIAPGNPIVERIWIGAQPASKRVAALEAYLANSNTADLQLRSYLAFLKSTAGEPPHACRLVSKVAETTAQLEPVQVGAKRVGALDLAVKLNNHNNRLVLDTGTSGIVIHRKSAERSGLTLIAEQRIAGVGDSGHQAGYVAVARRIHIGELEFQDCLVRVADSAGPPNRDGLIGSDVFHMYLIDVDLSGKTMRLSPLPQRPDETPASPALESGGETPGISEDTPESVEGEETPTESSAAKRAVDAPSWLPKDAYVAPEMANWSKVFRFGHLLLIPTNVNDSKPVMFMIDSGAFANILSTRAAQKVTQVKVDPSTQVSGMSGSVGKVYRAEKANLRFGDYSQQNDNIVALDLSSISRNAQTEVSGILGFELLGGLEMKIDYRDGLIDFIRNPKQAPKGLRQ
jgi:tetratricopeptide (TPR) repeat protein